jgi:hypothetical protein
LRTQALSLLPKPRQSKFLHLGSAPRVNHPTNSQRILLTGLFLDDMFFPDSLRDKCEASFSERNGKEDSVDYEFIVYKGLGSFHEMQVVAELFIPFFV